MKTLVVVERDDAVKRAIGKLLSNSPNTVEFALTSRIATPEEIEHKVLAADRCIFFAEARFQGQPRRSAQDGWNAVERFACHNKPEFYRKPTLVCYFSPLPRYAKGPMLLRLPATLEDIRSQLNLICDPQSGYAASVSCVRQGSWQYELVRMIETLTHHLDHIRSDFIGRFPADRLHDLEQQGEVLRCMANSALADIKAGLCECNRPAIRSSYDEFCAKYELL